MLAEGDDTYDGGSMNPDRLLDGRLKLRHLHLLVAIADHGSLVKAAEQLSITQPVLSRVLKDLKTILQVRLFHRVPTGVVPTEAGTLFLRHARIILGDVRTAAEDLAELTGARVGSVRVGTHLAGSNVLLPRAIGRLKAERPYVTVIVREATPDVLLANLLDGELDLIVGRLTSGPREGLAQRALNREPIVLAARRGHPAHDLVDPTLADLVEYAWILPLEQTALRNELELLFSTYDLPGPANRIECTSMLTLRSLLLNSDLVAALPALIALNDADLEVIPLELAPLKRAVGVTMMAGRVPGPTTNALILELIATGRELTTELTSNGFASDAPGHAPPPVEPDQEPPPN